MNVWRRQRNRVWLAAGIAAIMSAAGGAQTTDPAYGVWKLDVAKSKFSPGPAPKELTLTIEAAGPGRKVNVTGVDGEGKPIAWGYAGNFDSKPEPQYRKKYVQEGRQDHARERRVGIGGRQDSDGRLQRRQWPGQDNEEHLRLHEAIASARQ
jgi:hypothetical protein